MYKLPDALRAELAKPLSKVLTTEEAVEAVKGKVLVSVGDVCSEAFLEHGVEPRVIVADWKTQRFADLKAFRERASRDPDVLWIRVANPAGTITEELWEAIVSGVGADRRSLIEVEGEEDLAALPAILLAPEGAVVAYGQPNEGVVIVTVTPETRRHVRSILDRMEVA